MFALEVILALNNPEPKPGPRASHEQAIHLQAKASNRLQALRNRPRGLGLPCPPIRWKAEPVAEPEPETAYGPCPRYGAEHWRLCQAHDQATAPNVPRTDHEHHRQSQRARAIRGRLKRLGLKVRETEDGRLLPC